MAEAHTCPKCKGRKVVHMGFTRVGSGTTSDPVTFEDVLGTCPTCNGEGVVWDRGERPGSVSPSGRGGGKRITGG